MKIKIIKTEQELDKALVRMSELMNINPAKGTKEFDEMKLLSLVIKDYEDVHYPTPPSNPIEAIKFMMGQNNLKPVDMRKIFGTTSRYYEVIAGKRSLSINMIRNIHKTLGIPAEILIDKTIDKKSIHTVQLKSTHKKHTLVHA